MKQQKQKAVKQVTVTLYDYIQSELIKKGLNEFVDHNGNLIFFNDESQFMTKIFSYDEDISTIVDKLFTGVSLTQYEHDMHFKKAFLYKFINRRINRQTIEAFRIQLLSTFLMNKDYINRVYADLELYLTQVANSDQTNQQTNRQTNQQTSLQNNSQNNNEVNSQTNNQTSNQTDKQTSRQTNNQTNNQSTDSTATTDNREADARLPQNNVQLNVDSTVMTAADSNRISRNKQVNGQVTEGTTAGDTTGLTDGETIGATDAVTAGETTGTSTGVTDGLTTGETSGESAADTFGETKSYRLDELFKTRGLQEQIYIIFDQKCFMQTW